MADPRPVYKSKKDIRDAFNGQDFTEKIRKGQVSVRELSSHPAPRHLPFWRDGMKSRLCEYIGPNGAKIAQVHEYKNTDGSLGASGKPDPKRLVVGDELWIVDPKDQSN